MLRCVMQLSDVTNIEDLRIIARRRLPRAVFEFVDRGAEDEIALANNRAALEQIKLTPRYFRDVSGRTLRTKLFGVDAISPLIAAPTGSAGLLWHDGEVELANACARRSIPFIVSNYSLDSVERIAQSSNGAVWFQVYIWPDRDITLALVDRAAAAGCEVLVVTMDSVVPAKREYNQRNGFIHPYRLSRRNAVDMFTHPDWLLRVMLRRWCSRGLPKFENFPRAVLDDMRRTGVAVKGAQDLAWRDLEVLRDRWRGKLVVKGILHPTDADIAVRLGADGIVVSNHGGRTVDAFPAPIKVLASIREAVGDRASVFMDSGIRRGSDICKALALGADAVLLGRSLLYGVAAAGREGAMRSITILEEEMLQTMALLGRAKLSELQDAASS